MHPYYVARTLGGLLFLSGAIVGSYNIAMTIRQARLQRQTSDAPALSPDFEPASAATQPGE